MEENEFLNVDMISKNLDVVILRELLNGDSCGIELIKTISSKTEEKYSPKEATIYNVLAKLEKQGYVLAFRDDDGPEARIYYSITDKGQKYLELTIKEWNYNRGLMDALVDSTLPSTDESKIDIVNPPTKRGVGLRDRMLDDENNESSLQNTEVPHNETVEVSNNQINPLEEKMPDIPQESTATESIINETAKVEKDNLINQNEINDSLINAEIREDSATLTDSVNSVSENENNIETDNLPHWEGDALDSKLITDKAANDDDFAPISRVYVDETETEAVVAHTDEKPVNIALCKKKNKQTTMDFSDELVDDVETDDINIDIEAEISLFNDEKDEKIEEVDEEPVRKDTVVLEDTVKTVTIEKNFDNEADSYSSGLRLDDIVNKTQGREILKDSLFDISGSKKEDVDSDDDFSDNIDVSYSWIQTEMKKRGFSVRPYMQESTSCYYSGGNFYYSYKTAFHTGLLLFALMALEIFLAYYFLDRKVGNFGFLPYFYTILTLLAVPVSLAARFVINPTKKKRAKFSLKVGLSFATLIYINLSVVLVFIGFFVFNADTADIKSMVIPVFYPLVFLLNILVYPLIYSLLYKTRHYHLE